MPVLLALGVAGLVVLAAYADPWVLALAVIGVQAGLAYGLMATRNLPDAGRAAALILASGAGVVLALQLAEPEPLGPTVGPALWVLGPAVVFALALALTRRDGRERLVETTATAVTGIALSGLLALVVPLEALEPLRAAAVALAAAGLAMGVAVWWLAAAATPGHRWIGGRLAAVVLAAAAAALVLVDVPDLTTEARLVVGSAVAVTGLVGAGAGHRLGDGPISRAVLMPAVSLALTGPTAYIAMRLLFG